MKKIIIFILALSLIGCGKNSKQTLEKKETIKLVKTIELEEKTIEYIKDYNGELKPKNEVSTITLTGGDVTKIYLKNGDKVKKGDIILELTDTATEANFYEAQGKLLKAKSAYSKDNISFNKYKKLYAKELVSEDEYLNAKNNFETSLGELKVAEANFIRAKDNFDKLKVIAQIDGTITDLNLKEFEKTIPNQKLLTIVDNSIMELNIAIAGKDLKNIKVGDSANIFIEEIEKNLTANVTEINFSSNSNTKKYSVKLTVQNNDRSLLKGLYAKVKLKHGNIKGLFIPAQAIMIKDLYSYIAISRNNIATIYKVTPKLTVQDMQLIDFPYYKPNDKLIIEGQYLLNNNDKVREN